MVFPKLWEAEAVIPAATLRNVAHQLVLTKWTFTLDAGALPSAPAAAFADTLALTESTYLPSLHPDTAQVRIPTLSFDRGFCVDAPLAS